MLIRGPGSGHRLKPCFDRGLSFESFDTGQSISAALTALMKADELAPGIASITPGALRYSEMLVNLLQRDRRINKARLRLLTSSQTAIALNCHQTSCTFSCNLLKQHHLFYEK